MIPIFQGRKDPADVVPYSMDFVSKGFLEPSDVIVTAAVSVSGPDNTMTLGEAINFQGVITTYVSGGTAGGNYILSFEITTAEGDTAERSGQIIVANM